MTTKERSKILAAAKAARVAWKRYLEGKANVEEARKQHSLAETALITRAKEYGNFEQVLVGLVRGEVPLSTGDRTPSTRA